MASTSSLLARRRATGFQNLLPKLDCKKSEDDDTFPQGSPVSTTASSLGSPLQGISTDFVRQESMSSDPFEVFSERFEQIAKLGEGSCGVVYKAISREDQRAVALKVTRTDEKELWQHAHNEYNVLQQVTHPNIIKVVDFFTYTCGAVLVEELFHGLSLEKIVNEAPEGCIAETKARFLFIQLIDAVAHLHGHGIIHRDVKAENVLISPCLVDLRLIDFNVSKLLSDGLALTMTGTPAYMPPEVVRGNSPSEASDVWASGLCLHYMVIGRLPAKRGCRAKLEGPQFEIISEPCQDVLHKCMEPHRDLRPQAVEILAHSWLQDK